MFKVKKFLYNKFSDVTDVCMDESAVSSDPVIAFLLDEVVVKDWCKRASRNIITELQEICKLNLEYFDALYLNVARRLITYMLICILFISF